MRIIRNIKKAKIKNPVITLGTFDGVHLGHRKILVEAVKYAQRKKLKSVAITFDPHPQEVICPERGLRLLTTLKEREKLIAETGIDALGIIKFNHRLQKLSYEEFIDKYIVKTFSTKTVFVGYDYAFGRGREGGAKELRRLGEKYGFKVNIVKKVKKNHFIVKSQIIRRLISRGDFNQGIKLLGHSYIVTGRVIKGIGRGRILGFPTANLKVAKDKLIPAHGVYIGEIFVEGVNYRCLINIGARPTFPEDGVAFEVHILNFHKDILGKKVTVHLLKYLRPELQFSDVEELKKEIKKDIARAREIRMFT